MINVGIIGTGFIGPAHFHDGASVMFIIDAIVQSHQQQRWIPVSA